MMDNAGLLEAYAAALRNFRLEFSRGGAYTGIVLILLGMGLDSALYPGKQAAFAGARILVAALILCVVLAMRTRWAQERIQWLTFIWLLLPQLMIAWMIAVTEGAGSIYYVGMTLAIYSSGIVLAFGLWQNMVFGAISCLLYVCACVWYARGFDLRAAFVVNTLFLIMSASISTVFTYFNERARFMLFQLKAEVAQKNMQLEETNRNLADIKGQMLQQEKMAAIGTLAAGLLHEVNNPVNFCMMAIEVAIEDPAAKKSALISECLADARQGMQRVQHIVSDLKTFAYRKNGKQLENGHFPLARALDAAIRLVGHETKGVSIVRELPDDTMVRGDEAAIVGVLINLLGNAALSMRKRNVPPFEIRISARWDGDRLRISVRDNGPGIAPENLARVFEPFFTTREVGQGLGLGLSISYGVIERHGGTLSAESEFGSWASMNFDLPRPDWEGRQHDGR
ncbi:two-component system sensor histidine kinase PhcS [Janthinobacterium sp. K2Li3]|nr:two-component system sensor histidine kinase PhcS [Janthinobacterium sp. K2C7]MBB5382078.1 two-component system sensor histidine kinase PhcS [Janthinobacterium sp. K2Li3]MBB5386768.1 two-component system sensor histidine kinase PhcS [Janthinobacterium sp. K2E3]